MSDLIDIHLRPQLALEEGDRTAIYDDATGRTFTKGMTLAGNLTVGIGLNLMGPFDAAELAFLENNRIDKVRTAMAKQFSWFTSLDPVRQVAIADIAYNLGLEGLLHWPHFLAFMAAKDYRAAVDEIASNSVWISQVHASRAQRIEQELLTGNWASDVPVLGAYTPIPNGPK